MNKHFSLTANYTLSRAMGYGIESGGPQRFRAIVELSQLST